jgi:hypothetical protein
MEKSLEPQPFVRRSRSEGRLNGIRDGLSGGEDTVARARVDHVEIGGELVFGQGDDVGQVEGVRELSDDAGSRVEGWMYDECELSAKEGHLTRGRSPTKPDGNTLGSIHHNAIESLIPKQGNQHQRSLLLYHLNQRTFETDPNLVPSESMLSQLRVVLQTLIVLGRRRGSKVGL